MNNLANFQIPDVWEVKDVINKMKSVVLNYTEMEAKVHEATSNDPWGASSTLMQELAQGTYNYQYFNEIMPTVYRRFTEKESKQWRQIYKALVLLEYLIKNGSERVVDDARSHVSMIKVMRNFYYIDDKGKDEGLNVRNRAKEIVELLSSTDKIRAERKLAKKNRNKYIGVGSDSGPSSRSMGFSSTVGTSTGLGNNRYTGFGSGAYGNGGGGISFNGDALSYGELVGYPKPSSTGKYDEEDDNDDGLYHSDSNNSPSKSNTPAPKEQDLFGSNDDDFSSSNKKNSTFDNDDDWGDFACGEVQPEPPVNTKSNALFDDDFSDFQYAVPNEPTTTKKQQDLFDLLGDSNNTNQFGDFSSQPIVPSSGYQQQQKQTQPSSRVDDHSNDVPAAAAAAAVSTPTGMWAQASDFVVSLDSLGKKTNQNMPSKGPSMNALKSSSVQADWNNWASSNQQQAQPSKPKNSVFDDLLF
ncbi:hypothetical protein BD770DRAFT_389664 [Pilaira anomala]|nr:hypothetical protein BD770DRAFT_389664 [Pilaira anomala]